MVLRRLQEPGHQDHEAALRSGEPCRMSATINLETPIVVEQRRAARLMRFLELAAIEPTPVTTTHLDVA